MWTETTRKKYDRKASRYSSDTIDAEWAVLAPELAVRGRRGRPPKWALREIVDALFYLLRAGCPWRMLPKDFPPMTTVQYYFYRWRDNGQFEKLNHTLLMNEREAQGREASPVEATIMSSTAWFFMASIRLLLRRRDSSSSET